MELQKDSGYNWISEKKKKKNQSVNRLVKKVHRDKKGIGVYLKGWVGPDGEENIVSVA